MIMARSYRDPDGEDELHALSAARAAPGPGERILATARALFYEQGYAQTGINEVIDRSQASKTSFYAHFPGKTKLGEAYLLEEDRRRERFFAELKDRNYRAFVRAWVLALKEDARSGNFFGCAFADTRAQSSGEFDALLQEAMESWRSDLAAYLTKCDLQLSRAAARKHSALMLMQYEGAVHMWRLSGDGKYFDYFEELLLRLGASS